MAVTTTQKVKIKVKDHPREGLYVGRQTREHLNGIMKFMASSPKVPDLDRVGAFLKRLKKEDIVGIEHNQYQVVAVEGNSLRCVNVLNKREVVISPEDLTLAIGAEFADILYRNDKPFGIRSTKTVTVKIVDHSKKEESEASEQPSEGADNTTNP
jgi:hypothetical protein